MKTSTLWIVLGVLGGGLTTVCAAGAALVLSLPSPHGKAVALKGGGTLYYTPEVTRAEADKLGGFLNETFVKEGNPKFTAQLTRPNGVTQVRMCIQADKLKEAEVPFMALGYLMSMKVFDDQPLEVHLCDIHLKTLKTITITRSTSAASR